MLLVGSTVIGGLSAWHLKGGSSWLVASLLPPAIFLLWIPASEYFLPYRGGGASMWPIAFALGGSVASVTGCCALVIVRRAKAQRHVS